jgi:hypothetical protein
MANKAQHHLIDQIRQEWRVGRPIGEQSGAIIALRHSVAKLDDLKRLLDTLRQVESTALLDRELVAECWSIPYYFRGFVQGGAFNGDLKAELARIELQIVVELHRILGTPREIGEGSPNPLGGN